MAAPQTEQREIGSLLECLNHLHLESGTILTLKREETMKVQRKKIILTPLYQWLLAT